MSPNSLHPAPRQDRQAVKYYLLVLKMNEGCNYARARLSVRYRLREYFPNRFGCFLFPLSGHPTPSFCTFSCCKAASLALSPIPPPPRPAQPGLGLVQGKLAMLRAG